MMSNFFKFATLMGFVAVTVSAGPLPIFQRPQLDARGGLDALRNAGDDIVKGVFGTGPSKTGNALMIAGGLTLGGVGGTIIGNEIMDYKNEKSYEDTTDAGVIPPRKAT